MKLAVSILCLLLIVFATDFALAQAGQLCLFSDPQGLNCEIRDDAPGLLQVYVVHTQTAGATSVTFSAPKPACMTGATWLSDTYRFPHTGNSQTGLTVSYGSCLWSPIHVVTINYFAQGLTRADCPYEILPDPYNGLTIVDCESRRLDGQTSATFINSSLPCTCDMGGAPQLRVNPTSLDFGTTDVAKSFVIGNVGAGTLAWTLTESIAWLNLSQTSGTNGATINVTVDRSLLPGGIYTGEIGVVSNGGNATVAVRVESSSPAVLGVSPTFLPFPPTSSNSAISIWNDGSGTLYWNITSDQPWLSANPMSGAGDDQVAVYVERQGLAPGTYYGHLFVTSNGGNATVSVEMIASDAILIVNPNLLVFTPSQPTKTFSISNGGSGTLDWSLAVSDPWIEASPMSGTGAGVVTVTVDVGSLPCCNALLGHIQVNSNGGSDVVAIEAHPAGPGSGGSVGMYMDVAGAECNLSDATVGMITYRVVHVSPYNVTACAYRAPKPACFTATYLSDTNVFPVTIGNSQDGVSIGYGVCRISPVHVQSIVFLTNGNTPQCCLYPILGIPTSGNVEAVDCANNLITAYGVTSVINPAGSCNCGAVRVEESTWGRVKSLYADD